MKRRTLIIIGTAAVLAVVLIIIGLFVGGVFDSTKNDEQSEKTTSEILSEFRSIMKKNQYLDEAIQAYFIPSVDEHQSESLSLRDNRIRYVSKFTGSSSTAIITESNAALWVDSRYYLQAENQLDSTIWTLMKTGLPDVPSIENWLLTELPSNSRIGYDPFLMSSTTYAELSSALETNGHTLVKINNNLVDEIWDNRPELNLDNPFPLGLKFSGKTIANKLIEVRADIIQQGGQSIIVNALDDIAWLLNLRGYDKGNTPVFFSYVILTQTEIFLYINENRISDDVKEHFTNEGVTVLIKEYKEFSTGLSELISANDDKIVISTDASQAIHSSIPTDRVVQVFSRVAMTKTIKNDVEVAGMFNAHIKDGSALVRYLHWLDVNVGGEKIVTELSGAEILKQFRSEQKDYFSLSFGAISAFGANGAIVHYSPNAETDTEITRNGVYLIDSGGQYFDGTTDVTRTIHLGEPTDFQKEAFTRVLKGFLSIGSAIFPVGTISHFLDSLGHQYLWNAGLSYGHGTGHGIGSFLGVHEYPPNIRQTATTSTYALTKNQFTSNEPGYYHAGEFGIRIEDIVCVVPATIENDFSTRGALTFKTATLAPIQAKMIDMNLINSDEIKLINAYHLRVRETIGNLLTEQGHLEAYEWLVQQTNPIMVTNKFM